MADAPVISIVTPSYNQGGFIEETLASVLSQEGDFYLDYLVIDGASTDGSVEIIRRYADLLEMGEWPARCRGITFRWISEPDEGQADALQKGFARAEGDIFAWLNSDDVYQPGALQAVAKFFCANLDSALFYGGAEYCDALGKLICRYPTEAFDLDKLAWFNFFCQPSTFFRKAAFVESGGLDSSLHFAMDYDLFVRLGKSYKVSYEPRILAKYRLHEEAKTLCSAALYKNHEEALHVALKHFGWAPLNRVYGSCYYYCSDKFPEFLNRFRLFPVAAAIFCTLLRSPWLNRGLQRRDLTLLSWNNLRKTFQDRMDILRG